MTLKRLEPDAETALLLNWIQKSGLAPFTAMAPVEARISFQQRVQNTNVTPVELPHVRDVEIPTAGTRLVARIYSPIADPAHHLPIALFFHGGGFVIGNLDTHDSICRYLAAHAGCRVVAVDYRLAPEHPYPAAVEDAITAFTWLLKTKTELGGDGRIAVVGDSSGATLAALVAQHARDHNVPFAAQVLAYPALDIVGRYDSRDECATGFLLTRETMDWFARHYFGAEHPMNAVTASPMLVDSFENLAPALIITAGLDPLRDEGRAYADRLKTAGVKVEYVCFESTIHGFLGMAKILKTGVAALDRMVEMLKQSFEIMEPSPPK